MYVILNAFQYCFLNPKTDCIVVPLLRGSLDDAVRQSDVDSTEPSTSMMNDNLWAIYTYTYLNCI